MNKVQMVVIDLANDVTLLSPYNQGLWQFTVYMSETEQAASFWTTAFGASFDDKEFPEDPFGFIQQINANGIAIPEYDSIGDLKLADSGYLFDYDNQKVIVKLSDFAFWKMYEITQNEAFNIINKATLNKFGKATNTTYAGRYFEPRLVDGTLSDKQSVDDLLGNRMVFDSWGFTVENSDGFFDYLRSRLVGATAHYLLANSVIKDSFSPEDFEEVAYGIVEEVSYTNADKPTIRVSDPRKAWNMFVNDDIFTYASFPNLPDNNVDKRKPEYKNFSYQLELTEVDSTDDKLRYVVETKDNVNLVQSVFSIEDGVAVNYDWDYGVIPDTIDINTVEDIGGKQMYCQIYEYDPSPTDASLTANPVGAVDTALNIILDKLGIPYNDTYFDTAAIDALRDDSKTCGITFDYKGMKLKDAIEKILSSDNVRIQPINGKLSMSRLGVKEPVREILQDEYVEATPGWSFNSSFYMSTVRANYYFVDYIPAGYLTYYNNDLIAEALDNNNVSNDYEYDSMLLFREDIVERADERYERSVKVPRVVNLTMLGPVDFNLFDYVTLTLKRGGSDSIVVARANYEVIGLSKTTGAVTLLYAEDNPEAESVFDQRFMYNDALNHEQLN